MRNRVNKQISDEEYIKLRIREYVYQEIIEIDSNQERREW